MRALPNEQGPMNGSVLHHVAIEVSDLAASVSWYTDNFDVEVLYQDTTWAFLGFANTKLALVTPGEHPPHIAVEHPQADRFGKLKRHRDGIESTYTRDPGGNAVEIMKLSGGA